MCGTVRFTFSGPSKWCAHCHCPDCRAAHTAAFVTWFGVDASAFEWTAGEENLTRFASSPGVERSFCSRCGSTLAYEGERWPGEIHLTLASLEDELDRSPSAHVYWDRHVPWIDVDPELKKLGGPTGTEPLE